jgi:phosphopantetheinyl transferase (holo-ACP synthase)
MQTPRPCVRIDADDETSAVSPGTLVNRVSEALAKAEPVIVSCGAGMSLGDARAALVRLDQAMAPSVAAFGARTSRSATDGLAAWAADRSGPIGVDVQAVPAVLTEALLNDALSNDERAWLAQQPSRALAFARLWAAKEAVLKCFGVGLAWPLPAVQVLPVSTDWRFVEVAALGAAWLALPEHRAPRIAVAVAINIGQPAPGCDRIR